MVIYRKVPRSALVNKKTIEILKSRIKQTITSENAVLNILIGVLKLIDNREKKIITLSIKNQIVPDIEKCINNLRSNMQAIKNIKEDLSVAVKNKNDIN